MAVMTNDMGSLFVQPGGPNTEPFWLGCHDVGDISETLGDVTREYCPDPAGKGKMLVIRRAQGAEGEVTLDVTFPVGKVADYLEELTIGGRRCPVGLYINWAECGQRNWADVFDRGVVIEDAMLTARTFANAAASRSDGAAPTRSTRTFSFSGKRLIGYYDLTSTDRTIVAATAMLAVEACSWDECIGACMPGYLGQIVYATDTATALTKSALYQSLDFGVTWAPRAAFNADVLVDENVGALVCFPIAPGTTRLLMAKTETVAGTPARVFYSDDGGITYSAVISVGATNAEYFPYAQSLFALNDGAVWGCTDDNGAGGHIYKSADGGVTWTTQLTAAADNLNVIHFADENVGVCFGNAGECWVTVDSGAHWDQETDVTGAPSIRGCLCLDANRFWAATSAGALWYTTDGGATWAQRNVPLPAGATAIALYGSMDLWDDYLFAVSGQATVGGNNYGMVARTWDGGYNWETWLSDAVTTAPSTDIDLVTPNSIYLGA